MATPENETTATLRAVAHPLRLQILSLLTGAELSAAAVARELGVTHANASYHLRQLLAADLLEIASEEKIRGGVAKRYRHPWKQPARSGRPTPEDRALYARALAEQLVRRMRLSRVDRPGSFTDAELWVDPEDLAAARESLLEASSRLHSTARPPRTEGTVRVALTAALFEMESDA